MSSKIKVCIDYMGVILDVFATNPAARNQTSHIQKNKKKRLKERQCFSYRLLPSLTFFNNWLLGKKSRVQY